MKILQTSLGMGFALLLWFAVTQNAAATTITVTTTADEFDLGNNGLCSLREAVSAANTDVAVGGCSSGSGADRVILPAGTYILTQAGSEEDGNRTGDLDVSGVLEIVGTGQDRTLINANHIDRVLQVFPDSVMTVTQLSIINGTASPPASFLGGGVYNEGQLQMTQITLQGNNAVFASGIFNSISGTLTMSDVLVTQNTSEYSGAIGNNGYARISFFRVIRNSAVDSSTGVVSNGGNGTIGTPGRDGSVMELENGIIAYNTSRHTAGLSNQGIVSATNITISDNAFQLDSFDTSLPGLALAQSGVATFTNVTLFSHSVANAVALYAGSRTYFGNCIVAQLNACDASVIVSLGHNLTDCASANTGFSSSTDLLRSMSQFRLTPLRDTGGVDIVHTLLGGSPALNAGDNSLCPLNDQRGISRPQNGTCEIGAVEVPAAQQADLALTQTGLPTTTLVLHVFTKTLVVSNLGPLTATNVMVQNVVDYRVNVISMGGDGWSCEVANGVIVCIWSMDLSPGNASPPLFIAFQARYLGEFVDRSVAFADQPDAIDMTNDRIGQSVSTTGFTHHLVAIHRP